MRGKQRALDDGRWTGGPPPYGYLLNKDTKMLELYTEKVLLGKYSAVDIVKMMFGWCVSEKMTCEKIAMRLHEMKILPYTPGKNDINGKRAEYWSGERVRNLLSDETYTGKKIMGKRSKDGKKRIMKVPYIVSKDIWNRAQEVKSGNKILSLRNTIRQYLLYCV